MAALARWCVRHRLVVVLLWLLALGGTAAAAAVAGSAYSNDYEAPGTESGHATRLLNENFAGLGGDSDTVVWHVDGSTVRAADVETTMTNTLDEIAALPGVADVASPYETGTAAGISADGRTAYATVTFDRQSDDLPAAQAQAVVDTAHEAETHGPDGLQVELGGSAVALTEPTSAHVSEIVGVV
ncbi:MMPL family transporter, partial [Streptomyces sp. SID5785]|uniref:MMPL family transporter n=1 Tax=Streptomyces sp. SID5785 TaxID=2690309 RepID=UPI001361CD62|nr:MMPL family transporter [Streptomyces sp. SID5785]